ncbi:hypothetical protein [Listeria booriae]|uniref:Uncharacterized protein n=1 Tax=Listeria booriae TaxID=1552123 RepID=A0A7X1CJW5_9LIST|nr:hypothetical protein [Listeria booriae]MBC1780521.1 hypothetical protein [Listeria booriae]
MKTATKKWLYKLFPFIIIGMSIVYFFSDGILRVIILPVLVSFILICALIILNVADFMDGIEREKEDLLVSIRLMDSGINVNKTIDSLEIQQNMLQQLIDKCITTKQTWFISGVQINKLNGIIATINDCRGKINDRLNWARSLEEASYKSAIEHFGEQPFIGPLHDRYQRYYRIVFLNKQRLVIDFDGTGKLIGITPTIYNDVEQIVHIRRDVD